MVMYITIIRAEKTTTITATTLTTEAKPTAQKNNARRNSRCSCKMFCNSGMLFVYECIFLSSLLLLKSLNPFRYVHTHRDGESERDKNEQSQKIQRLCFWSYFFHAFVHFFQIEYFFLPVNGKNMGSTSPFLELRRGSTSIIMNLKLVIWMRGSAYKQE